MLKKIFDIDNKWFFTDLPSIFKLFLVFVKGDIILLLPFLIIIFLIGSISTKLMWLLLGSYITVRYLGELMYWIMQQFHHTNYRPYDWGFKKLNNQAIYIIYQTFAVMGGSVGITILAWIILHGH